MNLLHTYWLSLALSAVLFTVYMFAPWAYGMLDSDMQNLMQYGGYGAMFEIPEWVFWAQIIFVLTSHLGMALFRKAFRLLFVSIIVVNLVLAPIFGASVITGIEVFIIDTSTLLSGFVIALSYYTRLNDKFY